MDSIIEFILAALPFILIGLSIGIARVNKSKNNTSYIVLAMGFGIAIGSAIGYLSIGKSLGMLLGEIISLKSTN